METTIRKGDKVGTWWLQRAYIQDVKERRDRCCGLGNYQRTFLSSRFREKEMKEHLFGEETQQTTMTCRQFWTNFREKDLAEYSNEERIKICREVKKCVKKEGFIERRKWYGEALGKVGARELSVLQKSRLTCDWGKDKIRNDFRFVPELVVSRSITEDTLQRMEDVESRLILRLRGGGWDNCPAKQSTGRSLGRTVVSGGTHANKDQGVSGSTHQSKHFSPQRDRPTKSAQAMQRYDNERFLLRELEEDLLDVISNVLYEAFGRFRWYQIALEKLGGLPAERIVKGGKIPCSHIWWTSTNKAFNIHTDENTVGPAFLFTATTHNGGDLYSYTSQGVRKVTLERGVVVGGRWSQLPHCSSESNKGRRSFVLYLDYRMFSKKYVTKL